MNLEKNDDAGNSVPLPVVYNGTSHIEGRGGIREIEPLDNSDSLEAICSSTIEPVEDSFPLQASYSSTKPIVGSKLSPSCISSEVCSSSELSYQGKSDSDSSAAIDLENFNVGETALGASLLKGSSCTPTLDLLQGFYSFDHQNIECDPASSQAINTLVPLYFGGSILQVHQVNILVNFRDSFSVPTRIESK